ncbi:sensor histidine kinase [Actinomadura terrae]|uniref:sensor histidine kinase n=1 Tax=Actinomadura terrae TaxID=604353 RepID=UPI001FA7148F|nr:ATP-binding protein [Actinomadura terrae]
MRSVPGRRTPLWFGARVRCAAGVGAAVAAGSVVCGWPYWREAPGAAAVTAACCGGFAVAGGVLAAGRSGRRTGPLFTVASAAWAVTWTASWDTGAAPLVSVFAQSVFYLAVGTGVLLYPSGRLSATARLWTAAAALVLLGGQVLLCVTSRPEWNGFAPSATWPALFPDRAVFDGSLRVLTGSLVGLGGFLVAILLRRLPRTSRLERAFTAPVVAAMAVAAAGAVASQGSIAGGDVRLEDVLRVYLVQGVCATVLPLAFLGTALRGRLAELTVAERMQRLSDPLTVEKVRDALRGVLRDDTLDLWFWSPGEAAYVDEAGHRAPPGPRAPGRWRHEMRSSGGAPLALVELAAALRDHEPLVEAALAAGGRALETVRLQATAQAHLERARAARERLVRVQAAERERLAADLQRSARRRLRALEAMLAALEAAAAEPSARAQAAACRRELAEAVAELDDLARGVHPAILADAGLRPALELVAARAPVPVRLDLPARRFPPEIESTLYFALCEAVANAVKHARAQRVDLEVRAGPERIVARVRDDGVGAAAAVPGGGLAGLTDRVGALRGRVEVQSPPAAGTILTITLPVRSPAGGRPPTPPGTA